MLINILGALVKKLSDAHGSFVGQTTGELKASRVGRLVSSSAGFLLTP
jgi:hypothetical protein